ncbi:MAG: TolC family protein [Acidobacteriota bacterium]|nr:TolC family protein [Acidobacteriota bacterium]
MPIVYRIFLLSCFTAGIFGFGARTIAAQTVEPTPPIAEPSATPTAAAPQNNPISSNTVSNAPDLNRVGIEPTQPVSLSLNAAIRRALENNNNIEVSRDDVRLQETQLRSLTGAFDTDITLTPNYTHSSNTGSNASNDLRLDVGANKLFKRGGGQFTTFFNNTQTGNNSRGNTNFNQTSTLGASASSTTFFSNLGVNFSQPLFRNFKIDNTRRQIKIQRKRLQQSDADFRRQTIDIISQVQRAYWDLVFALRNQQNQLANVNLARENLRQIQVKIDVGAAAPLARAEVETELATREGDLLSATQQVSTTENTLKTLLLRDATAPEWTVAYVPTDTPVYSDEPIIVEDAIKDAFDNRPELRRLKLQRETNAIDISYFKNQVKPRIDLVSSVSLGGLALGNINTGTTSSPLILDPNNPLNTNFSASSFLLNSLNITRQQLNLPPITNVPILTATNSSNFFNGGSFQAFRNLFRGDAPTYSFGISFELPFRNTTAKANLAGARIQQQQTEASTRVQEQTVIAEVRNAVQAVETARQRVLTARRARANAEIQLEGERKLFEVGRSTTFLLFQRENSLTNARNAEIRAETDYNKALSDLQRASSTTFRINNIEVDSPSPDDGK